MPYSYTRIVHDFYFSKDAKRFTNIKSKII